MESGAGGGGGEGEGCELRLEAELRLEETPGRMTRREVMKLYGFKERTLDRLRARGKAAGEMPPFEDPVAFGEWWDRVMKNRPRRGIREAIERARAERGEVESQVSLASRLGEEGPAEMLKEMLPSSEGAPAGREEETERPARGRPGRRPAGEVGPERRESVDLDGVEEVGDMGLSTARKFVKLRMLDVKWALEGGDELEISRAEARFDKAVDRLRKLEKAAFELARAGGDLVNERELSAKFGARLRRLADQVLPAMMKLGRRLRPELEHGELRAMAEEEREILYRDFREEAMG